MNRQKTVKAMKKTVLHTVMAIFGIMAFGACEREIEFSSEELQPKLVLQCFLESNEPVWLTLKKGRFFLSQRDDISAAVNNAAVTVWKNDELVETLRFYNYGKDSYYAGSFRPQIGDKITIKATANGFAPVECSTVMPEAPVIPDVEYVDFIERVYSVSVIGDEYVIDSSYVTLLEKYNLTCRINDAANANYYRAGAFIRTYSSNQSSYITEDTVDYNVWIKSDDIVFGLSNSDFLDIEEENPYHIFSDELFNGKEYGLKFGFENNVSIPLGDISDDYVYHRVLKRECRVVIRSISQAYYLHVRSRQAAESEGIFSEPVQIYSNIQGGIGILAASTKTEYVIPMSIK
ncbi:MAG: DUF4249 domain-containing protein [Prevotellaceae bacterium]|nr:DUF4249 domain-containing protein [Prevotellaceae bacterium]